MEREIFERHMKKYSAARERAAAEEAEMVAKVDAYLASQVAGDMTYEQVRAKYIKEYEDLLDSPLIQPLTEGKIQEPLSPEEKLALVKRQIYLYEILPEEKKRQGELKKAA